MKEFNPKQFNIKIDNLSFQEVSGTVILDEKEDITVSFKKDFIHTNTGLSISYSSAHEKEIEKAEKNGLYDTIRSSIDEALQEKAITSEDFSLADYFNNGGYTEVDVKLYGSTPFTTTVWLDNETPEQDAVIDYIRENLKVVEEIEEGTVICYANGFIKAHQDIFNDFNKNCLDEYWFGCAYGRIIPNDIMEKNCAIIEELLHCNFSYEAYEYLANALELEVERYDEISEFQENGDER